MYTHDLNATVLIIGDSNFSTLLLVQKLIHGVLSNSTEKINRSNKSQKW